MKINKILLFVLSIIFMGALVTSCYESYEDDFEKSFVYFASQKPFRTLVADTGMSIKVGVAIGGKRSVDTGDWATFRIDPALLEGTGLVLMPEEYYQLADPGKMTVSNPDLAIADVRITFSDSFYEDKAALDKHYAIPFRLVDHNLDEVSKDADGKAKDYTIVAVKFVSKYHGTYFLRGAVTNTSTDEVFQYGSSDLSKSLTREFSSTGRNTVRRPGLGHTNDSNESLLLTINDDGSVSVEQGGSVTVSNASALLDSSSESLDMVGKQPKFTLSYDYIKNGVTYHVEEELIRRQSPEADLRFQEW